LEGLIVTWSVTPCSTKPLFTIDTPSVIIDAGGNNSTPLGAGNGAGDTETAATPMPRTTASDGDDVSPVTPLPVNNFALESVNASSRTAPGSCRNANRSWFHFSAVTYSE
jgi:hypothetical protein